MPPEPTSIEVLETVQPAGLKTKAAQAYVGGRPVWDCLKQHYPQHLIPFYRTRTRGDGIYRRELLDQIVRLAEVEGKLDAKRIK